MPPADRESPRPDEHPSASNPVTGWGHAAIASWAAAPTRKTLFDRFTALCAVGEAKSLGGPASRGVRPAGQVGEPVQRRLGRLSARALCMTGPPWGLPNGTQRFPLGTTTPL